MSEGSVVNKFITPLQTAATFAAVLGLLSGNEALNGIEPRTADVIEAIQKESRKINDVFLK